LFPSTGVGTSAGPSIADLRGKNVRSVEELEADMKHLVSIKRSFSASLTTQRQNQLECVTNTRV
jgi:hypothetical protein